MCQTFNISGVRGETRYCLISNLINCEYKFISFKDMKATTIRNKNGLAITYSK